VSSPHGLTLFAGDKDGALRDALGRLAPARLIESARPEGQVPATAEGDHDRDPVVTAVHRLPALPARHAPFPAGLDPRLTGALTRLWPTRPR